MMNKGILYKIFIVPLLLIPLVCPFHISADDYTNSTIVGHNVTLDEVMKYTNGGSVFTDYIYKAHFILDNDYIGQITITFNYSASSQGNQSFTRLVNVNGDSFDITFYIHDDGGYTTGERPALNSTWYSVQSHNLELKLTNDWQFPIESFTIVKQAMDSELIITDFYRSSNYIFPIFIAPSNKQIAVQYCKPNQLAYFIFGYEFNLQIGNYMNYLDIQNADLVSIDELYYSNNMTIKKLTLRYNGSSSDFIRINNLVENDYMPIWFGRYETYLSTEFAQNFGMSNPYLDDIDNISGGVDTANGYLDIIAQGTSNSNTSASNLETVSDDISSSSDDLIQSENSFNNSMNSNLQQIDTNINIGNLGNKFLASAEWVRVQFNTLTNGTPFGSVLSFSLLLGLALVLVGRIRK